MESTQREFLEKLLSTSTPSGFETSGQRQWIDYVSEFADEVRTDDYGNAIAILKGGEPSIALTGHSDEIGFMIRDIKEDGSLRMCPIGGSDRTISKGQHVVIHTDDGPVPGVIGQTAIHLRDEDEESLVDISEQHVDIGVDDAAEAKELVERGDPITFDQNISELENDRIAARGLDNRIGIWAAAEGLRRAADRNPEATIYAVSTVQEEIGLQGAKMVGFDLDLDAVIAVDVTHATDSPDTPDKRMNGVKLGSGPVVTKGAGNHPRLVRSVRDVGDSAGIDLQLQPAGTRIGTDADAFYTSRGGVPSMFLGVPNRYMHTPVELLDLSDLERTAELLGEISDSIHEYDFSLEI